MPPNDPLCNLDDADCAALSDVLGIVARRREYLAKLDKLGLQVNDRIAANEAQGKFCEDCKREFFPHKP